jgi:DnaJ-class molecular chaperone
VEGLDHYKLLGVSPQANTAGIERAYRDMVARLPPDWSSDSPLFQYIRQAYETLRDPDLRAAYDNAHGIKPISEPPVTSALRSTAQQMTSSGVHDNGVLIRYLEQEKARQAAANRLGCIIRIALALVLFITLYALIFSHW